MVAWWKKLNPHQRSGLIATGGVLLSLATQFGIPALQNMGGPCSAFWTAFCTWLVNAAKTGLLALASSEALPPPAVQLASDNAESQDDLGGKAVSSTPSGQ